MTPMWKSLLLALLALLPLQAWAAVPFVMGTDFEETTLWGKWYRLVYGEAFRRMEVPLGFVLAPTARLTAMADAGEVHGQPTRVRAYADDHPNQIRVEEVLHEVRVALYAHGAKAAPERLEDLATGKWAVEYRRGVAICEKALKPVVPAGRLSDVTGTDQGLLKLRSGRTDLYCEIDVAARNAMLTPEFRAAAGAYRKVLELGPVIPLHPYLHKSRAELAPKLAETLRKMKAEGLFDRYLRDAEKE